MEPPHLKAQRFNLSLRTHFHKTGLMMHPLEEDRSSEEGREGIAKINLKQKQPQRTST